MNIQQLQYIVALEKHRQFVLAAEKSSVTQATLSMMVKKLEDELGVLIFDRKIKPLVPTEAGAKIIAKAKKILSDCEDINAIASEDKDIIQGRIRIGVIHTVSPYITPLFLMPFMKKFPLLKVELYELTTEEITDRLCSQDLDVGIMATPLDNNKLKEIPTYYEELLLYSNHKESLINIKADLTHTDVDVRRLWLLDDGHCLKNQTLEICKVLGQRDDEEDNVDNSNDKANKVLNLTYQSGSLETLYSFVKNNYGYAVLPFLATLKLCKNEGNLLKRFVGNPCREISIVTYHLYNRDRLITALKKSILENIPKELANGKGKIIPITSRKA